MGFWLPETNSGYYSATPVDTPPLIYYVEALCVLAAITHCCSIMSPGQKLLVYTDNMNVVDIFSSLRCRPEFNNILKDAISTRVNADVDMRVLHVAGDMNGIADAISRADFNRARTLAPNISFHDFSAPSPFGKATTTQTPSLVAGGNKK